MRNGTTRLGHGVLFGVLTVALGAFAGAFAWAFFFLMNLGIDLLWVKAPTALEAWGLPAVAYPLVFCALGGLVIGLFQKRCGPYPQDMNTVMAEVKSTGRYDYRHMGASFGGALLPLLFGGSIGPEAGLTGVIAGLCTWVGDKMRFMGAQIRELSQVGVAAVVSAIFSAPLFGLAAPLVGYADESQGRPTAAGSYGADRPETAAGSDGADRSETVAGTTSVGATSWSPTSATADPATNTDSHRGASNAPATTVEIPKPAKLVVYLLAVAGALGAMLLLGNLFGHGGGLPHFSDISLGAAELAWALPCVALGAAAGWLFHAAGRAVRVVAQRIGERPVAKAVIAGALLGAAGIALPFTLFAGEAQTEQLAATWTTLTAGALIATGFLKVVATQACLGLGWRGGHFFPIIFAGIALGYGMAALTGIDPVFALCATTAALLGTVMRQPVMTALLLFLVFPVKAVFVLLTAAALGALVPVPQAWLGRKAKEA